MAKVGNPLTHLMAAHDAVKSGDKALARHHIGHAFRALKEDAAHVNPSKSLGTERRDNATVAKSEVDRAPLIVALMTRGRK